MTKDMRNCQPFCFQTDTTAKECFKVTCKIIFFYNQGRKIFYEIVELLII